MKKSRFSEAKILEILKQAEGGVRVPELCREHGMSNASFYKWHAKFGGMDASIIGRMKEIEDENKRLKKMYAEMSMQNDVLKEALGKKWGDRRNARRWRRGRSSIAASALQVPAEPLKSARHAIAINRV